MQGNKGFVIRHEKGRHYPALVCEECGEVIKDVAIAGVVWPEARTGGRRDTVTVLCKTNRCLSGVRYRNLPWQEMRDYLLWLAANSGLNTEEKVREAWQTAEEIEAI